MQALPRRLQYIVENWEKPLILTFFLLRRPISGLPSRTRKGCNICAALQRRIGPIRVAGASDTCSNRPMRRDRFFVLDF
jgi:hypothetical protein